MPIAIKFVSSRRKKIAVDVVPAEWQTYIGTTINKSRSKAPERDFGFL